MNQARRNKLKAIIKILESQLEILQDIYSEEFQAFCNLPDSLAERSNLGVSLNDNSNTIHDFCSSLEEIMDEINDFLNKKR